MIKINKMYTKLIVVIISIVFSYFSRISCYQLIPEIIKEALMKPEEAVKFYGHKLEYHYVETTDNYILTLDRILTPKAKEKNGVPILNLHGLNCQSSQEYTSQDNKLFLLADQGYDVWSGNFRGSIHSSHKQWTRKQKQFWNYGVEQQVLQDLPAMIDYVLKTTKYSKLILMTGSMSTTISFIMLAMMPQYNQKVAGNIAFGPVLSARYIVSPYFKIMKTVDPKTVLRLLGQYQFNDHNELMRRMTLLACPSDNPFICLTGFAMFGGYNGKSLNITRVPIYAIACHSGTSLDVLSMIHDKTNEALPKDIRRDTYDNIEVDFTKNKVPTVLIYAANDAVANPLDVVITSRKLPNVIAMELIPDPMGTHAYYLWGSRVNETVNPKVFHYVNQFAKKIKKSSWMFF